ncbi:MAG: efflux RND transporter periplasmic adaptor subunit [Acutalibacteraceae bacterium]|jgi:multidrug efflux pump subunit AcrA (membrane-fusion protein)
MKKAMVIAAAAVLLGVAATAGGSLLIRPKAAQVSLATVDTKPIRRELTLTGRVESAQSRGVCVPVACVVGTVAVKPGQVVEKGERLFTVDGETTRQVAAALTGGDLPAVDLPREMTAPIKGVVSTVNVQPGDMADPGTPSVVISSGEALQIKVGVPEKELPRVAVGQAVTVKGVAFQKQSYRGTLTELAPTARTQLQGTAGETVVDAVIALDPDDLDESLRIGLTATAAITLDETPAALIVPFSAVTQQDDGREFVYLYQNGRAVKRLVTTGRVAEGGFEVIAGLSRGDRLIRDAQAIKDGMAVTAP